MRSIKSWCLILLMMLVMGCQKTPPKTLDDQQTSASLAFAIGLRRDLGDQVTYRTIGALYDGAWRLMPDEYGLLVPLEEGMMDVVQFSGIFEDDIDVSDIEQVSSSGWSKILWQAAEKPFEIIPVSDREGVYQVVYANETIEAVWDTTILIRRDYYLSDGENQTIISYDIKAYDMRKPRNESVPQAIKELLTKDQIEQVASLLPEHYKLLEGSKGSQSSAVLKEEIANPDEWSLIRRAGGYEVLVPLDEVITYQASDHKVKQTMSWLSTGLYLKEAKEGAASKFDTIKLSPTMQIKINDKRQVVCIEQKGNQFVEKVLMQLESNERVLYLSPLPIEDDLSNLERLFKRSLGSWVLKDSHMRAYTEAALSGLSVDALMTAREEILARAGHAFKEEDLQAYFSKQSWYTASDEPRDLNAIEASNYALLTRLLGLKTAFEVDLDGDGLDEVIRLTHTENETRLNVAGKTLSLGQGQFSDTIMVLDVYPDKGADELVMTLYGETPESDESLVVSWVNQELVVLGKERGLFYQDQSQNIWLRTWQDKPIGWYVDRLWQSEDETYRGSSFHTVIKPFTVLTARDGQDTLTLEVGELIEFTGYAPEGWYRLNRTNGQIGWLKINQNGLTSPSGQDLHTLLDGIEEDQ